MVQKYTYLEIYLNDLNEKFNLKEFAKYYDKPHQTIKRHLSILTKEKVLIEEKKDKFRFYKLNLEHPLLFEYLSILEKTRLIDFVNSNKLFKALYKELNQFDAKILIFGSSVENIDFDDIDILILSKNKNILKTLKEFEKTYSIKLHILQTEEKNLTKTFKNELINKHIYINNQDYFVKLLYGKWREI